MWLKCQLSTPECYLSYANGLDLLQLMTDYEKSVNAFK